VSNGDPGFLTRQAMRVAFSRFARDYSVYIVHRKRGLPTLRAPTLVIGGDRDPFFPAPLLQETTGLIPNAVFKMYAGAGHGLPKTHKQRFEDDVLAFLAHAGDPVIVELPRSS
jgi:pimeloyl-ACP methyl ester carboxylesterase